MNPGHRKSLQDGVDDLRWRLAEPEAVNVPFEEGVGRWEVAVEGFERCVKRAERCGGRLWISVIVSGEGPDAEDVEDEEQEECPEEPGDAGAFCVGDGCVGVVGRGHGVGLVRGGVGGGVGGWGPKRWRDLPNLHHVPRVEVTEKWVGLH